jgi:hypothetical protein
MENKEVRENSLDLGQQKTGPELEDNRNGAGVWKQGDL